MASIDVAARIDNIGKDHGGPAKDVVLEFDTSVDGNIVLDLDVVPNLALRAYHDVLTEVATNADFRAAHNVAEVPDPGSWADFTAWVDDRGRMRKVFGLGHVDVHGLAPLT